MSAVEVTAGLIIENIVEGLYFVDVDRRIHFWNKGAELITGFSAAEVLGRSCSDNVLVHVDSNGKELCAHCCPIEDVLHKDGNSTSASVYLHHKNGHRVPVNIRVSKIRDASGAVLGAAELFWPATGSSFDKAYIDELKNAALIDPLTEVLNRRGLDLELISTVEESRRHDIPFGVIFSDIDNFKGINDNYGHDFGDKVLQMVARTLGSNIRSYDHLGRWGGEEFLILARHVNADELKSLAIQLKTLVARSFILVDGEPLSVTLTIGTAHSSAHDSINSMMKQADLNLLKGKNSGKNCVIS